MPNNDFVSGLKLETKEGQYGEYIKGTINTEEIFNNPINNGKYLNFMIFKSKAGKWYAVVSKSQNQNQNNNQNIISFDNTDEEIPF